MKVNFGILFQMEKPYQYDYYMTRVVSTSRAAQ